jgi:hypothetical protein
MGVHSWHAPKQEVHQPLGRGRAVFRPTAVEPGRQPRRLMDDLVAIGGRTLALLVLYARTIRLAAS